MTTPRLLTAKELSLHNIYVFWPKFQWETRQRHWSISSDRSWEDPVVFPIHARRPFVLIEVSNPDIVSYGSLVLWLKVLDPDGGLGWMMVTDPHDKFAAASCDTIWDHPIPCE